MRVPLKQVLDMLSEPVGALDANGICVYGNPALYELLEVEPDELLGFGPIFPCIAPEHATAYSAQVLGTLDETLAFEPSWGPFRLRTRNRSFEARVMRATQRSETGEVVLHWFLVLDEERSKATSSDAPESLAERVSRYEAGFRRMAAELSRLAATTERPASAPPPAAESLSLRESEVLTAFLGGATVPEMARLLHISRHTVRNHLKSIFRKLGVHSQRELLAQFKP